VNHLLANRQFLENAERVRTAIETAAAVLLPSRLGAYPVASRNQKLRNRATSSVGRWNTRSKATRTNNVKDLKTTGSFYGELLEQLWKHQEAQLDFPRGGCRQRLPHLQTTAAAIREVPTTFVTSPYLTEASTTAVIRAAQRRRKKRWASCSNSTASDLNPS
jgi:hypothetical protein